MCDCERPRLVTDWENGDVVCAGCGVVVEGHIIDETPEWRNHAEDAGRDRSRVGQAGAELGTFVDVKCSFRGAVRAFRGDSRSESLTAALRATDECVSCVGMSSASALADTAKMIIRDLAESRGPVRSDVRRATAAAAVYLAFKIMDLGREMRFVSNACVVEYRALGAAVTDVKDALVEKSYHPRMACALRFGALIDVFLDKMNLGAENRKKAWREARVLDELASERVDSSRKPRTLCCGLLYLAIQRAHLDVSRSAVATACGVCVQTLDKAVELIKASLERQPS